MPKYPHRRGVPGWLLLGLALLLLPAGAETQVRLQVPARGNKAADSKGRAAESGAKKAAPAGKTAGKAAGKAGAGTPPGPHPLPRDLPREPRFVVIALHDEVSLGMSAFVQRVCEDLDRGDVLVLDINTFGGRVDAAVVIRDTLLGLRDHKITSVAYVHPRAISAGALISFASRIIAVSPGATIGASAPVQLGAEGQAKPAGEKVVSYMRKEMRATAEVFGRNGDLAEAMVDEDVVVPGLIEKGKLLTLDGKGALRWGVASLTARDRTDLFRKLGYSSRGSDHQVQVLGWNWGEKAAGWLSSATVSGLLMSIGMLGLLIGLYSGGSPGPLIVGGVCLALFFFGQYLTQLAGLEDVLLLLLGLVLVGVEAVHPGLIFPGILGGLCILGALAMGLVSFERVPFQVQLETGMILRAVSTVMGSIFFTAVLGVVAIKLLPRSRFGRALVLRAAVDGRAAGGSRAVGEPWYVGAVGTVVSDLRPAGKVRIGGQRHEALAELGFIEAGTRVRVVRKQGYQLVVAPAGDEGDGEEGA
jgi:membrane-bound serine protease (ClpP class)